MSCSRFQDEYSPFYEDQLSEDENEDVVRAIELSCQESKGKEIYTDDMEFPQIEEEEEEELAKALVESTISSKEPSTSAGCRGLKWWKLFKEFNPRGPTSQVTSKSGKRRNVLICDVCEEQIRSAYLRCTYWGQTYCEKHISDGTPQCCSCSRLKFGDHKYISLSDGRKLCPDCRCTSVLNPEECEPLLDEVLRFYKGLNMKIKYYIPILLVDDEEMIKMVKKSTLGLTTYRSEVVTCLSRSIQNGENVEVVKQEYQLQGRKVASMQLLYGFPRLAMGATLAHEMMHAWMRIEGYKGVALKIAEGICEVMAHKWLEWYAFAGEEFVNVTSEEAQFLRNLKEFLKDGIEKNYSENYGHGFRDAKWAVERYGLKYTMKQIAHTGQLPH